MDSSSEVVYSVRVAGFGVCYDSERSYSSPLPVHDLQPNIRGELWAVLWTL